MIATKRFLVRNKTTAGERWRLFGGLSCDRTIRNRSLRHLSLLWSRWY